MNQRPLACERVGRAAAREAGLAAPASGFRRTDQGTRVQANEVFLGASPGVSQRQGIAKE